MKQLILGGARSGKSRFAESLALATGLRRIYIATAEALDDEMHARIDHHRQLRAGQGWQTVEEPLSLAGRLQQVCSADSVVLVDCLTLWLTNLLLAGDDALERERTALLDTFASLPGTVLLVSNEVGMGVVPADPLSRRFVDESGRLHQALAAQCDHVTLLVAGLPLRLA